MTVMENHSGRQGRPQAQVAHPGQPDAFERLPELQPACQRVPSSLRGSGPALASLARACSPRVIGTFGGWVAL